MEEIKLALDAISIYQTQYAQVDKIWGYFSVVTLATAGFVIGSERSTRTVREPVVILAAYLVFCVGNHQALIAGQKQLEQLSSVTITLAKPVADDLSSFVPMSHDLVGFFHMGVVTAVCIGVIVVAALRRRRKRTEVNQSQEVIKAGVKA